MTALFEGALVLRRDCCQMTHDFVEPCGGQGEGVVDGVQDPAKDLFLCVPGGVALAQFLYAVGFLPCSTIIVVIGVEDHV
eukprot:7598433-Ditylum_brightwellii.AAC.2